MSSRSAAAARRPNLIESSLLDDLAIDHEAPGAEPPRRLSLAPAPGRTRRPVVVHTIIVIGCLALVFAAQLMLSIALADGAYRIDALRTEQRDLVRNDEALSETLEIASSTQRLAQSAAALGMVTGGDSVFLDLVTGAISLAPGAGGDPAGCGGACNLAPNSLLTVVPPLTAPKPTTVTPATVTPLLPTGADTDPGAAVPPAVETIATTSQTTPPGMLPAPVTH